MTVVALALTGCSSGTAKKPAAAPAPSAESTTSSTAPVGSPTLPGQASTTTTVAPTVSVASTALGTPVPEPGPPPTAVGDSTAPCRTFGLRIATTAQKHQGGNQIETFTMTNTSQVGCTMRGYPSVVPYRRQSGGGGSSSVQALVGPIPAQAGAIGAAAQPVALKPGQTAVFFLMWSPQGVGCQVADGVSVNTPVSSTFAIVSFPFSFCGSAIQQSVVLPAGTIP
jgi:hypothetical protein